MGGVDMALWFHSLWSYRSEARNLGEPPGFKKGKEKNTNKSSSFGTFLDPVKMKRSLFRFICDYYER